MFPECLEGIEMPVFTREIFKLLEDRTLCPGVISIPAGLTLRLTLSPRSPGEARQVPEAAGGRDRAEPAGQETPGDDELVRVPDSLGLHHLHLISVTLRFCPCPPFTLIWAPLSHLKCLTSSSRLPWYPVTSAQVLALMAIRSIQKVLKIPSYIWNPFVSLEDIS